MAANAGGRGPVTNINAPAKKRAIWLAVGLGIVAVGVVVAIGISLAGSGTATDTGPDSSTAPNAQPATTSLPADQGKATEAAASPPTQVAVAPQSGGTGSNYVGPTVTGVTGLAPHLTDVTIISDSVIQTRGGHVTVAAHAKPKTGCTIKVQYLSGNATAPGLEPKTTDDSGNVSWTWVIAQDTKSGAWPAMVTCGDTSAGTTVTVP